MVTLAEQKKTLLIKHASGEPLSLDLPPVDDKEIGCTVFFSSEGRYVAVALNRLHFQADSLHIVIVESATEKVTSNFVVHADETLGKPLTLLGFFENSSSLVVFGKTAKPSKHSFSTALLDIQGKQTAPAISRLLADNTSVGNPAYADVKSNRLWFHSNPQFCPLRSVPLVEEGPEGAVVSADEGQYVCDGGNLLMFPEENELMVASQKEPRDLVWRVNLKEHTAEQIELPTSGGAYTSIERSLLSPDGKVFVVVRNLLSNSPTPFGNAHSSGAEVDAIQVTPLKLIGKIRLNHDADPASLSIDHENGVVTILNFVSDKWVYEQLKAE